MENSSAIPLPAPYSQADAERCFGQWGEMAARQQNEALCGWMLVAPNEPVIRGLMGAVFGNSPYLSHLLLNHPAILRDMLQDGADRMYTGIAEELKIITSLTDQAEWMRRLRIAKGKTALLVALADIAGVWPLEQVTRTLSDFAASCLNAALNAMLAQAARRGEIEPAHLENPSQDSGIIVLGMGKLGGYELNYSSDIDLILFYEPGTLGYKGRHNEQHFMNKLAHDLVTIMQERTADGYVFRTDLRLRPDPASTPPAITVNAAYNYYESVGQNWERAAMIKARPVAGDIEAGERFLKGITAFMWRRNLDFAAIDDIHSIKRQMDSRQSKTIHVAGHNIKLGIGGIREIEFFAQIHQLIWGGREKVLRTRATCETLEQLQTFGLLDAATKESLISAYGTLRKLEHRLQMIADAQTHSLPETEEGVAHVARFMGYSDTALFEKELLEILNRVHSIYASSFKNAADPESKNLGSTGNLVFTGTLHDPETLATLRSMGFSNPETVSEVIMGWHHGSRRATRTKRARELLTELMPTLLGSLAKTAHPDSAFLKFNEFLSNLPAGVQLFSLFHAHPHLLQLIADIMGSAPMLADSLSRTPQLLEAVLYGDFYAGLLSKEELSRQLDEELSAISPQEPNYFEECLNRLRHFRNEKHFQAGIQLLRRMVSARDAGIFLSDLAETILQKALSCVTAEFVKTYGEIPGSRFAIIGLGKLGSKEMTFSSDIDLVFIYDVPDFNTLSDGDKNFSPSVYYNRLCQRFLNALTAMGSGGKLYDVDTRLRPSGKQGLLAVSTKALSHYFDELAWTFEYMAFTKARIISADPELQTYLEELIVSQLSKARDAEALRRDVADMRNRIEKEHGSTDPWDIKYVRGGLMDIEFIAQYLLLLHASAVPGVATGDAANILRWLSVNGSIAPETADILIEADIFLGTVFHILRLCSTTFDESSAPEGLKKLLVESVTANGKTTDFETLKARLIQVEQTVRGHYSAFLQPDGL